MARAKKIPAWPFKPTDNPVGLALQYVDALFERVAKGKVRLFDLAHISQLVKLDKRQLKEVNERYALAAEQFKSAIAGDAYWLEAYSNFNSGRLRLAHKYVKAIKATKPDETKTGKVRQIRRRKIRA